MLTPGAAHHQVSYNQLLGVEASIYPSQKSTPPEPSPSLPACYPQPSSHMFDSPLPESLQCSLLAAGQRAHQTLSAVQSLQSPFKPVLGSILLFCSFLSFHCLYCWFLPALDLKLSVSEYVTDTFLASSLRIFGLFFICFLAYHAPCVLSHTNFSSWCRINLMFLFLACCRSVFDLNYN